MLFELFKLNDARVAAAQIEDSSNRELNGEYLRAFDSHGCETVLNIPEEHVATTTHPEVHLKAGAIGPKKVLSRGDCCNTQDKGARKGTAVNWDETTESDAGRLYTKIKAQ